MRQGSYVRTARAADARHEHGRYRTGMVDLDACNHESCWRPTQHPYTVSELKRTGARSLRPKKYSSSCTFFATTFGFLVFQRSPPSV
jgi:hypothetical protein